MHNYHITHKAFLACTIIGSTPSILGRLLCPSQQQHPSPQLPHDPLKKNIIVLVDGPQQAPTHPQLGVLVSARCICTWLVLMVAHQAQTRPHSQSWPLTAVASSACLPFVELSGGTVSPHAPAVPLCILQPPFCVHAQLHLLPKAPMPRILQLQLPQPHW